MGKLGYTISQEPCTHQKFLHNLSTYKFKLFFEYLNKGRGTIDEGQWIMDKEPFGGLRASKGQLTRDKGQWRMKNGEWKMD